MTAMPFDPVLSAALRNRLEALADAEELQRRPFRHRPQAWITAVTALVLLVVSLGVLQLTSTRTPIGHRGGRTAAALVDPLTEITDRSSQMYVSDSPSPILHARADRTRTFALTVPASVRSVRFYLVCTAGSSYAIRTDTEESGHCRGSIGGYSDDPAAQLHGSVTVTVPAGTRYVLLAIPTPTDTQSVQAPDRLPLLSYPADGAPNGDSLIGRQRSSTTDRVVGNMTKPAHSLFVLISCQGSGTLVISTQNGFTSGSAGESPNRTVCGIQKPITTSYGDSEEGGMEHYGHMRYAIQPVGDVTWTVSFYDSK